MGVKRGWGGGKRPPLLYKYFPPEPYVEHVLSGESIKFACPLEFNDPFEFRPLVKYSDLATAREKFREMLKKKGLPSITAKHLAEGITEKFGAGMPFNELSSEGARDWGALCLTRSPTSLLMWAHYARDHTGICIGFRTSEEPFANAMRVRYSDAYPVMDFSVADDNDHLKNVRQALLVKSKCWSYEEEWRVLRPTWTPDLKRPLGTLDEMARWQREQAGPGLYPIPRSCLASVIVGARCSEKFVTKVREWSEGIVDLQTLSAKPADREFKLELLQV